MLHQQDLFAEIKKKVFLHEIQVTKLKYGLFTEKDAADFLNQQREKKTNMHDIENNVFCHPVSFSMVSR